MVGEVVVCVVADCVSVVTIVSGWSLAEFRVGTNTYDV